MGETVGERNPDLCGCKKPAVFVFANGSYCEAHAPGWTESLVEQGAAPMFDGAGHVIGFRNAEGLPGRNPDFPICFGGYEEIEAREALIRSSVDCDVCRGSGYGTSDDEEVECPVCLGSAKTAFPIEEDVHRQAARYELLVSLWKKEYHLLEMQRAYDARRAEVLSREVARLKRGK